MLVKQTEESRCCRFDPDRKTGWPARFEIVLVVGLLGLYLVFTSLFHTTGHYDRECGGSSYSKVSYLLSPGGAPDVAPTQHYEVIASYPHDRNAFTQGLAFHQGALYESTGIQGRSSIRNVDLQSGKILNIKRLDDSLFGEGLTAIDDRLVQLTWKSGTGFVYEPGSLDRSGSFSYSGEGWGIASIDGMLVVSDGSSWLQFLSPDDFQVVGKLQVTERGIPVEGINELESANGMMYANIYPGDCIARIDMHTGQVRSWINLEGLMPLSERPKGSAVSNGIAYDPESGDLFVTGKLWPYIYQLRLLDNERPPGKQDALPKQSP